jgi:hypothetical protein
VDLKLRSELGRLSILEHTTSYGVVQEALDIEYRWKHFNERLTACLVDARWIEVHRLWMGDLCE